MNDYVFDASALVLVLIGKTATADTLRSRLPQMRRHAPHLVDAEVGNVLRRHEHRALISADEARAALDALPAFIEYRYPHSGTLAASAWSHRHNLTFYAALYVAVAAHLGVPLVTADTRLRHAPGLPCAVELV